VVFYALHEAGAKIWLSAGSGGIFAEAGLDIPALKVYAAANRKQLPVSQYQLQATQLPCL